jgi:outer membrane protein assembly factor BamE (lipoprotein component of BamABCDE complex)
MKDGIVPNKTRIQFLLIGIAVVALALLGKINWRQAARKEVKSPSIALDWQRVSEGMTKEEITTLLGKPMRIQEYPQEGMTEWWYMEPVESMSEGMQFGGGSIVFEGERVVKVLTTDVMVDKIRN